VITAIARRLRAAREADQGFSIIEVMVAMTIFAMIAAGVAMGIASTLFLTQDNRSREAALNLANQALDAARSTKDVFTLDDDTSQQSVGAQNYTIQRTTNWINSDGTDNSCGAGSGVLAYKRVAVTVSWSSHSSPKQKRVVLDSLIAPSSAVSSATASTIVVGVQTATGGPNQGVNVVITARADGAKSLPAQPAATDANGCSYALGVTPGTYRITITKAGNIDPDGAPAVSGTRPSPTTRASASRSERR
jgi:prepilin-type N-terminal cleavage/methylation domain-containing protein